MKKILNIILFLLASVHSVSSQVILDSEFGLGGKLTTSITENRDMISSIKIQSDGKILACGKIYVDNKYFTTLVRYNTNGNLDQAFGNQGIIRTTVGSIHNSKQGLQIQDDGKILVACTQNIGNDKEVFAILRFDNSGNPDNTFGNNGIRLVDFSGPEGDANGATAITIQQDNKIVVAGWANGSAESGLVNGRNFGVLRLNLNGSLDDTFGLDGIAEIDFSSDGIIANETVEDVKIQDDGKIIIAGYSRTTGSVDMAIARLNANGSIDVSFGDNGVKIYDFEGRNDRNISFTICPDNKIITAGNCLSSDFQSSKILLAKFNNDGTFDNTFGTNGITSPEISPYPLDYISEIILQADGKLLAAGYTLTNSINFTLMRFISDGSLDPTFNYNGYHSTADFDNSIDVVASIALQNDGKIILGGSTTALSSDNYNFALARYINEDILSTNEMKKSRFSVYPNPGTSKINLSDNFNTTIKNVAVYNILGQLVLTNTTSPIDISSLTTGNYTLKIETENESQTVKFIKK